MPLFLITKESRHKMAKSELQNPIFTDETAAREYLEAQRWPDGAFCPHCGVSECTAMNGKSHRAGLYQCNACRMNFTVTVGTLYERSKIPLSKWLLATYLLSSSKKGMSANQIHRMLGVTYKTAWFMCHRIREAMIDANPDPMGGNEPPFIGCSGRHRLDRSPTPILRGKTQFLDGQEPLCAHQRYRASYS